MLQNNAGGRSGWASGDDLAFLSVLVIVCAGGVYGYIAWIYHSAEISRAFAWFAHQHIRLIHMVSSDFDGLDRQLLTADYNRVTLRGVAAAATAIGRAFRLPVACLLLILAVACALWAPPTRYTRRLDLDGLIQTQARVFRTIAAYATRQLRLAKLGDGPPRPADPALHVAEWVRRVLPKPRREDGKPVQAPGSSDATIRAALTRQLGPAWRGAAAAAPHAQFLFAVFALHRGQRRAEAFALLGDMAEALAPTVGEADTGPQAPLAFPAALAERAMAALGEPDGSKRSKRKGSPSTAAQAQTPDARPQSSRPDTSAAPATNAGAAAQRHADAAVPSVDPEAEHPARAAERIAAGHAFTAPALMSLLTEARRRAGVLPPASFNGLKLVDRDLWYALHSLGFPSDGFAPTYHPNPTVEAIGARDHWAAERALGAPIPLPALDRAIAAIRGADRPATASAAPPHSAQPTASATGPRSVPLRPGREASMGPSA